MKHLQFLIIFSLFYSLSYAQLYKPQNNLTFLLTGASFASSNNGWFELGCETLGVTPINRAVGGEAIADAANRINEGTLYNKEEFENIDALVIMQVHDKKVFDESLLKNDYKDYHTPFSRDNYAAAFDYLIKQYITECYNLKFDENSKYYKTQHGKPAVVVLCTHWHDARVVYNSSIRMLADKWGFPVVEFDKYIGFTKTTLHPVTGKQISRLFAVDTQESDGNIYGWHPENGKDKYIQQRMGAIFADTMRKIFPFK